MRIQTMIAIASLLTAGAAAAAPDADQADKFMRDLRAAVDAGPAAIDAMPKRRAHQVKLQELEARAKRLFADGACVKAASTLGASWNNQMQLVASTTGPAPRDIALLAQQSVAAGAERYACSIEIDALRPPLPQECMVRVDVTNPSATIPPRPAHCPKL
jgi:hypothetical protein